MLTRLGSPHAFTELSAHITVLELLQMSLFYVSNLKVLIKIKNQVMHLLLRKLNYLESKLGSVRAGIWIKPSLK